MARRTFFKDEENPYDYSPEKSTSEVFRDEEKPVLDVFSAPVRDNEEVPANMASGQVGWGSITQNFGAVETRATRNPRTYDSVVDANGKGDYKDIQSALNDGKKRIFVKNGTYLITSTINLLNDNISIVGEDKYNTILQADGATEIINIGNGSIIIFNITIQNCHFFGNSSGEELIKVNSVYYLTISDCKFSDSDNFCISVPTNVQTSRYVQIVRCEFSEFNSDIIDIVFLMNFWIIDNVFIGSLGGGYKNLDLHGGTFGFISRNYFYGNAYSVYCDSANNKIIDNFCGYTENAGVYVGSNDCIFSNNLIEQNHKHGIHIDTANYNIISSNVINDSSYDYNDTYNGIFIEDTSTYNIINSNQIVSTSANKMRYGVQEESASDNYNIITNNVVQGAVTANILTQGANTIKEHNIE